MIIAEAIPRAKTNHGRFQQPKVQHRQHTGDDQDGYGKIENSNFNSGSDSLGKGFQVDGESPVKQQENQGHGDEQRSQNRKGVRFNDVEPAGSHHETQYNQEQGIGDTDLFENQFTDITENDNR